MGKFIRVSSINEMGKYLEIDTGIYYLSKNFDKVAVSHTKKEASKTLCFEDFVKNEN